jgi:hypothetical protein
LRWRPLRLYAQAMRLSDEEREQLVALVAGQERSADVVRIDQARPRAKGVQLADNGRRGDRDPSRTSESATA